MWRIFLVEFGRTRDGRLSARYNLHPDQDGILSKGKMIFPDKAFTTVDVGLAIVSVTREFDTYAFVQGKMVRYDNLTLTEVLNWAWENHYGNRTLAIIGHPSRGRYYTIKVGDKYLRINKLSSPLGDEVYQEFCQDDVVAEDALRYVEREVLFSQLFIENIQENLV